MHHRSFTALTAWLAEAGLAGQSESALLDGFCDRLVAAGVPLAAGLAIIDTLHPVYEGRLFRWQRDQASEAQDYTSTREGETAASWRRSPFYHLLQSGESALRRRLTEAAGNEFPALADLRALGMTDYLALLTRFAAEGIIGDMDCVYSRWSTDAAEGFTEDDIAALEGLMPHLALAMKCASLGRIARTLVETYLGRDAGRLVLEGRIQRGVADRIDAVIWFSDLRGFTAITDSAPPEQIVPLLNDYAEAIVEAVQARGGDVLKLIGDGVLAIFRAEERPQACRAAIQAAAAARDSIAVTNRRRAAANLPTTQFYLGLHVGEVHFGNIGSQQRLDFTVVGPAVNEVSRIAALCRSVERRLLVSAAFAGALDERDARLVSIGHHRLRGVRQTQELFALETDGEG